MKHWYALYTQPRKERQVHGWLVEQGFESFLPTVRRKVRRSDRPDEMALSSILPPLGQRIAAVERTC